jgi:hypothetical protein
MDIRQAIDAHVAWKGMLATYLSHPNQSLDADTVALDDQCDLGKWLQSEGQSESEWPGFAELLRNHARFHLEAANLVRSANAGGRVAEEAALGSKSDYAKASNAVTTALLLIKSKLKQAARGRPEARASESCDAPIAVPAVQLRRQSDSLAVPAALRDAKLRDEIAAS